MPLPCPLLKNEKGPLYDLLLVGTDPHTTAIFGVYADMFHLRLIEAQPSSIAGFLKKEWENWVVLVLDDSVEGWFDTLSLVTTSRPDLPVIVVTSRYEFEYLAESETVARLGNDNLEAARVLGMGKSTLYRKLKEYGLGLVSAG